MSGSSLQVLYGIDIEPLGAARSARTHGEKQSMLRSPIRIVALALLCLMLPMTVSAELVLQPNMELENRWKWTPVEEMLTGLVSVLNQRTRNIPTVSVVLDTCGKAKASYTPATSTNAPRITICTELVEHILDNVKERFSDDYMGPIAVTQISFLLTHEFSHALVNLLELSVSAKDHDSIDQLSFVLMEDAGTMIPYVASFWATQRTKSPLKGYAKTHQLNEKRMANMLCLAYGADPMVRYALALLLPQSKRPRCEDAAAEVARTWKEQLGEHLHANAGTVQSRRSATGVWTISEHLVGTKGSYRCPTTGTFTLIEGVYGTAVQKGACLTVGQEPKNGDSTNAVHAIKSTEDGFTFKIGDHCFYTARYEDASRLSVRGDVRCSTGAGTFFGMR